MGAKAKFEIGDIVIVHNAIECGCVYNGTGSIYGRKAKVVDLLGPEPGSLRVRILNENGEIGTQYWVWSKQITLDYIAPQIICGDINVLGI